MAVNVSLELFARERTLAWRMMGVEKFYTAVHGIHLQTDHAVGSSLSLY
jgi:hypothetical protein